MGEDAHEVDRAWGALAAEGGGHLRGTQEEGITGPFPIGCGWAVVVMQAPVAVRGPLGAAWTKATGDGGRPGQFGQFRPPRKGRGC